MIERMKYSYDFPRAALTVDGILVAKEGQKVKIALIRRKNSPFKGKWALPGGFINMDETLEDACKRELAEETGIKIEEPVMFGVYDSIDRDPRGRTISAVFYKLLPSTLRLNACDDAELADWFPVDNLPELAFDHLKIIRDFLIRAKIPVSDDTLSGE